MTPSTARAAALLALLVLSPLLVRFYARNPRLGTVPETVSAGVTAHALVRAGTVDVTPYYPRGEVLLYGVREHGDRLYSIEPLASSLTFTPLFLPYRDTAPGGFRMRWPVFATAAAQLTTLTVLLLAAWMLSIAPLPRALLVTGVLALATSVRTIDAAGLWQHTSAAPWAVAGLALWSWAPRRPALYPLAGACLALATACRPIFLPAALLVTWAALRGGRRGVGAGTAAAVAVIGGLALLGNWYLHGSLLGGRASIVTGIAHTHAVSSYFAFSPWNLIGLLAAPSRGLFVYSPVLLFALPGLVRSLRASAPPAERLITVAGLAILLLYGFVSTWWAGWVFGTRYMTDLMPFFALWLARSPVPARGAPVATALFVVALLWSFAVQELGVRAYPCGWDRYPISIDQAPDRLWRLDDTELGRCWRKAAS